MHTFKPIIKILFLALVLIYPISVAIPSVPDVPIFEYNGDGAITFFNTHTDETMQITYKDKRGHFKKDGLEDVYYILRCRLTNQVIEIDPELIALIDHIQDHFEGKKIEVISGYRSPALNNALSSRKRGVAKRSLHMQGKAIDIRIPGVSLIELRNFAKSLKAGGVGYYSGPNFVHIDTGRVRYW